MPNLIGYNPLSSDNTLLRGNRVASLRTHAPWLDIPRVFGLVMRSKNLTKCPFQLQRRDRCEDLSANVVLCLANIVIQLIMVNWKEWFSSR